MNSLLPKATLVIFGCLLASVAAATQPTKEIPNFRTYSASFASSGQITGHHLKSLQRDGFKRIVYLAYRSHGNASDQLSIDRQATDLGMSYVHIPVPWQSPSLVDYQTFAAVMNSQPAQKTLLHCQMNYRASAFSFLYRVLELNTPFDEATRDLFAVWNPDKTWLEFINTVLAANNRAALAPSADL
ncbi:MAG: hypothetical protein CMP86_00630 [Gammaproteobacteria bacterium]|nr:hypothetical protein [Gammaproteobacteria bacterium]